MGLLLTTNNSNVLAKTLQRFRKLSTYRDTKIRFFKIEESSIGKSSIVPLSMDMFRVAQKPALNAKLCYFFSRILPQKNTIMEFIDK